MYLLAEIASAEAVADLGDRLRVIQQSMSWMIFLVKWMPIALVIFAVLHFGGKAISDRAKRILDWIKNEISPPKELEPLKDNAEPADSRIATSHRAPAMRGDDSYGLSAPALLGAIPYGGNVHAATYQVAAESGEKYTVSFSIQKEGAAK